MLDYYGSISKPIGEVDNYIVDRFRGRASESYLRNMLKELREAGRIPTEYSVSGWMVFGGEGLSWTVKSILDEELKSSKQRLAMSTTLLQESHLDYDVLKKVFTKSDGE